MIGFELGVAVGDGVGCGDLYSIHTKKGERICSLAIVMLCYSYCDPKKYIHHAPAAVNVVTNR